MKKIIFSLFVLTTTVSFSQTLPKFELTKDGAQPIVVNFDSISVQTLYKKTLNWVQENYKNPKEVLKTNIENETVRIDGYKKSAWFYKSLGMKQEYDMEYSLKVEFKEGKMRLTFTPGQFWGDGKKVLYSYPEFFKNNGDVKGSYKDAKPSMEESMNDLVSSLYNYVKGNNKSDW